MVANSGQTIPQKYEICNLICECNVKQACLVFCACYSCTQNFHEEVVVNFASEKDIEMDLVTNVYSVV